MEKRNREIREGALRLHRKNQGKLEVRSKIAVNSREILSYAYTPGVAEVCREIQKDTKRLYEYTIKSHTVAVITDGSAVLGLGNIGPAAALPVMEGKCMLFREMAGIDAFPLCLGTQDPGEIITIVKNIATGFGGINLEDIAAPRCFEIEDSLQGIGIPVMHDDQHGAGVITRAALINAAKVVGKEFGDLRVAIIGAGAAGTGIARLLMCQGLSGTACTPVRDVVLCDSRGILHEGRSDMNPYKAALAALTNVENRTGGIAEAIVGMDALIGVSVAGILKPSLIATMARDPIVFAMANPVPEILPDAARAGGAAIVGTGRSDFPNQINNALAFPGIFRGALDARARTITPQMKLAAAEALAAGVGSPEADHLVPDPLDRKVPRRVASAVARAAAGA